MNTVLLHICISKLCNIPINIDSGGITIPVKNPKCPVSPSSYPMGSKRHGSIQFFPACPFQLGIQLQRVVIQKSTIYSEIICYIVQRQRNCPTTWRRLYFNWKTIQQGYRFGGSGPNQFGRQWQGTTEKFIWLIGHGVMFHIRIFCRQSEIQIEKLYGLYVYNESL